MLKLAARCRFPVALALLATAWHTNPLAAQTWSNKVTTTPVYLQDGFGPAGNNLPFGGQEYCCPTAATMSLAYLGVNGFNQIAPSNPTTADGLNLDHVLSGLMSTAPTGGTASNSDVTTAISTYLAAKGISSANGTVTITPSPTLSVLSSLNQNQTVVDLVGGFYNSAGSRIGGHCVALVSQGVNAQGQSSPNTIIINNPLPGAFTPLPDITTNSLQYLNTQATSSPLTGDGALQLDPTQYPGFWGTTRLVIEQAIAITVNPSQLSVNNPTPSTWTLSSTQTIDLQNGSLTVLAPLAGSGGINKGDAGVLELEAANTTTGANTVVTGTLRSDVASGRPFGSGSISLQAATLQLVPAAGSAAVALTGADGSGNNLTFSAGGTIILNRNGNTSLTFTIGGFTNGVTANLARVGHGTLVIAPASGTANLGTLEQLIVNGSGGNLPTLTNGIVSPAIVAQDNDTGASGDFLTYGTSGFAKATYTSASTTPLAYAGASTVFQVDVPQSVMAATAAQVYALKVGAVSLTGGTINSVVQGSGGITTFGPGTLTLSSANTYTGATIIQSGTLNASNPSGSATGSGAVTVGTNGTLQISGSLAKAGTGGVTVLSGGTLLLGGGTVGGALTMNSGSYLFGSGTVTGTTTVSGYIGSSATNPSAAPYTGVENITFNGATTFNNSTIYAWRLNALDATPANAGVNWSYLKFAGAQTGNNMGTSSSNKFNFTLDLGSSVPDPNSGNAFWNSSHQWIAAQATNGFYNIWFFYDFATYSQGYFSLSVDSGLTTLYVNYTPTPEPSTWSLLAVCIALAVGSLRRQSMC